jgi:hypothetical protein
MNLKSLINGVIILLLVAGVWATGGLVLDEIKTGNGCPKIWIIPACAIILICFLIPLIVHVLKKCNTLYFVFTGLALGIAIIATVMQFTGNGECPKLNNGIPMCYLSFLIFTVLIVLKRVLSKM